MGGEERGGLTLTAWLLWGHIEGTFKVVDSVLRGIQEENERRLRGIWEMTERREETPPLDSESGPLGLTLSFGLALIVQIIDAGSYPCGSRNRIC